MHDYATAYPSLRFAELGDGVLEVTMSAPGRLNAVGHEGHRHLAEVWTIVDRDPDVRVAIVRGEGGVFSSGGDLDLIKDMSEDFAVRIRVLREARDLVYSVIHSA